MFKSTNTRDCEEGIIMWLDAGVIYIIADSSLVCPIQCISKKGGMIFVSNEKNNIVPMITLARWRCVSRN